MTRLGTMVLPTALLAFLVGCAAEIGDGCDENADCTADTTCVPPGTVRGCGICSSEPRTCETDPDCAEGTHCEEYDPICPPCDGILPTQCVQDCDVGSCAEDQRCDFDGGACVPLRCTSGEFPYHCPSNFRCEPAGPSADEHGCERVACDRDRDCDHGDCVLGRCYDGEGTCMGAVP